MDHFICSFLQEYIGRKKILSRKLTKCHKLMLLPQSSFLLLFAPFGKKYIYSSNKCFRLSSHRVNVPTLQALTQTHLGCKSLEIGPLFMMIVPIAVSHCICLFLLHMRFAAQWGRPFEANYFTVSFPSERHEPETSRD